MMLRRRLPFTMSFHPILAASLLILAVGSILHAREARAIYLPCSGGPLPEAHLVGAGVSTRIDLPQRNLSAEVVLADGDLVLAALASPPANLEEIPKGAPLVRIPASWERCFLIFLGDPTNEVFPVRVIPVNAGVLNFPQGSTRVFNLSETLLGGAFGGRRIVVKPGETATFEAPIRDFGSYPVAIDCLPKGETRPRAICRSTWQHDPAARQILFVVPQNGRIIPRVWGVLDQPRNRDNDEKTARIE